MISNSSLYFFTLRTMGTTWCCLLDEEDAGSELGAEHESSVALVRTREPYHQNNQRQGGGDPHGLGDPIRAPALSIEDVALVGAPSDSRAASRTPEGFSPGASATNYDSIAASSAAVAAAEAAVLEKFASSRNQNNVEHQNHRGGKSRSSEAEDNTEGDEMLAKKFFERARHSTSRASSRKSASKSTSISRTSKFTSSAAVANADICESDEKDTFGAEEGDRRYSGREEDDTSSVDKDESDAMQDSDEDEPREEKVARNKTKGGKEEILGTEVRPHLQLVSLGIIGTGRSSSINTLLNSSSACKVSGGQLRGTRGFAVSQNIVSEDLPGHREISMDFIDSEGLRRDKNVDAPELEQHLGALARSLRKLPNHTVSHIIFTLDLEDRQNAPTVWNLLTLVEAFRDVRTHCFLCLTKWNSNSVQAEWNDKLREFSRANRRAKSASTLKGSPPKPAEMHKSYLDYLAYSFQPKTEEIAREKLERLLEFFEDRIIWAYNLDSLQVEDREDGELPPMFEEMYRFYRDEAIVTLCNFGGTPMSVNSLELVKCASEGTTKEIVSKALSSIASLMQ